MEVLMVHMWVGQPCGNESTPCQSQLSWPSSFTQLSNLVKHQLRLVKYSLIKYIDDEGDLVTISDDMSLSMAVRSVSPLDASRPLKLFIVGAVHQSDQGDSSIIIDAWHPRRLSLPNDGNPGGSGTVLATPSHGVLLTPHSPFARPLPPNAIPQTPLAITAAIVTSFSSSTSSNTLSTTTTTASGSVSLSRGSASTPASPEHAVPYPPLTVDVATPQPSPPRSPTTTSSSITIVALPPAAAATVTPSMPALIQSVAATSTVAIGPIISSSTTATLSTISSSSLSSSSYTDTVRIDCRYGTLCRDTSLQHRQRFYHPPHNLPSHHHTINNINNTTSATTNNTSLSNALSAPLSTSTSYCRAWLSDSGCGRDDCGQPHICPRDWKCANCGMVGDHPFRSCSTRHCTYFATYGWCKREARCPALHHFGLAGRPGVQAAAAAAAHTTTSSSNNGHTGNWHAMAPPHPTVLSPTSSQSLLGGSIVATSSASGTSNGATTNGNRSTSISSINNKPIIAVTTTASASSSTTSSSSSSSSSAIVECKFFTRPGGCRNGASCPYRHLLPNHTSISTSSAISGITNGMMSHVVPMSAVTSMSSVSVISSSAVTAGSTLIDRRASGSGRGASMMRPFLAMEVVRAHRWTLDHHHNHHVSTTTTLPPAPNSPTLSSSSSSAASTATISSASSSSSSTTQALLSTPTSGAGAGAPRTSYLSSSPSLLLPRSGAASPSPSSASSATASPLSMSTPSSPSPGSPCQPPPAWYTQQLAQQQRHGITSPAFLPYWCQPCQKTFGNVIQFQQHNSSRGHALMLQSLHSHPSSPIASSPPHD